jgi:drug/metabolite transporter (DMT)-like permease
VLAVLFAAVSGALFGALAVTVRLGLRRGGDPEAGAAVIAGVALCVAAVAALVEWEQARPAQLWPFILAGALVPGASQILFVLAVRDAGPSRTAVLIGTAPLISVLIALTLLDEPFHAELLVGTALVVAGGIALAREHVRPEGFRTLGATLALTCAGLFAVRDNLVRWGAREHHPPALLATAVSLAAAVVVVLGYLVLFRRRTLSARLRVALPAFLPAGLSLGAAYVLLFEAFRHGRVSIVAPLNATQSLWGVALAALVVGRSELIGRRLVAAAVLVVAGSVLIGVFR